MTQAHTPAKKLIGQKVLNRRGALLGVVEDIWLDTRTGRAAYVAITLQQGDTCPLVLPWSQIALGPRHLLLNVHQSTLNKLSPIRWQG